MQITMETFLDAKCYVDNYWGDYLGVDATAEQADAACEILARRIWDEMATGTQLGPEVTETVRQWADEAHAQATRS